MKLVYTFLITLIVSALLFSIAKSIQKSGLSPHYRNTEFVYSSDTRVLMGDDAKWSSRFFDDSAWPKNITDSTGIFWIRVKVEIDSTTEVLPMLALQVEFLASFECYWDGTLIGVNGTVGTTKSNEEEGTLTSVFAIPNALATPGPHLVAFRASNQNAKSRIRYWGLRIGAHDKISRGPLQFTSGVLIFAGIFFVIGLYYLFIYFIPYRKKAFLIFGLLNLTIFALISFEYFRFYHHYHYSFHYTRLLIIEVLSLVFFTLLVLYHLISLSTPKPIWVLIILVSPVLLVLLNPIYPHSPDLRMYTLALVAFSISALIVIYSMIKKRPGSHLAFMGIAPCFLIIFYYDLMLFLGFVNLVVFNLISLTQQLKVQKQIQQASSLRSLKLESELLRKNIQPHFIMNTLTSVMEWIEQDPQTSIHFIQALADEFKILNAISNKTLIPLKQEMELCDVHLKIMSYRKGITYILEQSGLHLEETIPPAIFHVLVENAISHGQIESKNITFFLSCEKQGTERIYHFFNQYSTSNIEDPNEGMGTKYIKTRLEESYGDNWTFSHGPKEEGWQTSIRIPAS